MSPDIKSLIKKRQQATTEDIRHQLAQRVVTAIQRRKAAFYRTRYACSKARMWKHYNSLRAPSYSLPVDATFGEKLNHQFSDKVWEGIQKSDLSVYLAHCSSHLPHPDYQACLHLFNHTNVAAQFAKISSCPAGPDNISGKLLFAAKNKLIPILTKIYNVCLMYSICPIEWLSSNITVIPKSSNASEPADFRPIAITSAMCKIFERIIAKFILKHTCDLLANNKQYGFLPGHCTMDAVIQALDHWGAEHDNHKGKLLAIFFDFAKAFDLVDHEVLLIKLSKMLPSWLVSWIAAYLTGRRQRVVLHRIPSEWKDVRAGVIQGSVLGPILFVLFVSDINLYIPNDSHLLKYADDILAYLLGNFDCKLPQIIIDGVEKWCLINKMRLNNTKCKLLSFGLGPCRPSLLLNGIPLDYVNNYTYLGVDLNVNLDPSQQWLRVYSRVRNLPHLFRKLRYVGWTKNMLLSAYRAYGLSHFDYSAVMLMSCSKADKTEMARLQHQILKIVGVTQNEAATNYNILPISTHIDNVCARIFHRIVINPAHPITSSLNVNARKPEQFTVPIARTARYHNSFLVTLLRSRRDGRPDLYTNSNNLISY